MYPAAASTNTIAIADNNNMNILDVEDVDLDLELDLSINLNVISPMWPENDFLANTKDLTDAILADELSFPTTDIDTNTNNDIAWNTTQGLEHFYYEDVRPITDDANNALGLYKVDVDEQNPDSILESWPDSCNNSIDVLKDSLFELEIFSDCLTADSPSPIEIETTSTSPCAPAATVTVDADPIVEWNRRRSLLYDKNEFVKSDNERNRIRVQSKSTSTLSCLTNSNSNVSVGVAVDQRTFKCSVRDCEKTYYKASHLKSHMRRHSGVKPFACDWDGCKWRFSRSDELSRHKRSHSGIKPYSCDLCDKAFSRSDHLSKHAKVHMKKMALYGTPIITKKCNYKYLTVNRIPVE